MLRNLFLSALLFLSTALPCLAADVVVEKYDIEIPKDFFVPYTGVYADRFPEGFTIGIGSGMTYVGKGADGARIFYAISDRGPNADAPKYVEGGKTTATKMFPAPDFAPSFGAIRVKDGHAVLASLITLKNENMKPISGRAIPIGSVGATGEIPLNDSLKKLAFDPDGLDTEGIAIDREDNRNLWICDEYGPFIAKIDGYNGRIIKKYVPGKELPMIATTRQPNRGLEGIAVTPSNKVLSAIQSICDVDGNVKKSKATFIRLLYLDPATGSVKQFAYPHNVDTYPNSAEAKIGDLHAISDTEFILIERGKCSDGKTRIPIYVIDISDATDISNIKAAGGNELETLADRSAVEALGVTYVKKTKLIDIKDYGWKPGKAEGVALLPDMRTLAVTSDNDFGFTFETVNPVNDENGKPVTKAAKYTVDPSGQVRYNDKPVETKIELSPTGTASKLWLFTLPKRVTEY
ncbi:MULTISPECIES: esterase-like activity of phytase family protein [unclassified Pseudodesulfovibrio]|uniref:esterase-like activity of phytase family protein n=1 Tax=unclassified Pseudodesulfovibrio TaxID=2661612 RepID=UPI000FEB8804|nr:MULTISPECIES: esterase-like activity of phytase family protein [unclassified Pseudodesulfovibrio]MCJ2164287.1 esterase-like activity of phytase family protein [Pseudodesulfovibrio sp. S3-i]RWU04498.1 esterase-like activity of phytase family protein [Pseudodesulfovibrio sp. S3]